MQVYSNKIITPKMKDLLREALEKEDQQLPPHGVYYTQTSKGLVNRGLMYAKEYTLNGKLFLGFYLTETGRLYVKEKL